MATGRGVSGKHQAGNSLAVRGLGRQQGASSSTAVASASDTRRTVFGLGWLRRKENVGASVGRLAPPSTPPSSRGISLRTSDGTDGASQGETELVYKLERRGSGWSEEILPHLVVEHRPVKSKPELDEEQSGCSGHNRRGQTSGTSKYIQLEDALLRLDLTSEEVNDVISVAVAWRVTEGGQILVDRRRRAKALRNVQTLVPYLERLGMKKGKDGIGGLIAKVPLLILCNVESSDNWDKRAVQLAVHWFEHGTFQVTDNKQSSRDLKRWCHRVRRNKALGKLSSDQVKLLELIGFDFGLGITSEWEGMFDKMLDFILEHGHSQVKPVHTQKRQLSLHQWTELQRIAYAAGRLAPDHVERLESINFDWKAQYISTWLRHYQHFRSTSRSEVSGTMRITQAGPPVAGLTHWRMKQQAQWYTNVMMPERETMLKEAYFVFDPYSSKFNEVCGIVEALQAHHKVDSMLALLVRLYDDYMLPQNETMKAKLEGSQLRAMARWMKIQIALHNSDMLTPAQKRRLDKLGFEWEGFEWQMNFESLLKFRAINGHCDVERDHKLHAWVVNMRQNRHDLPFEYKALLDMVGFTWERRGAWSKMFNQLQSYQKENGHVSIPRQGGNYLYNHLGAWLMNQRALWRMGKLSGQQISRLEAIGVTK